MLNCVQMIGNLTRDPELKYTPSGTAVLRFSIANNRTYTQNGEKKKEVSFFEAEAWGKMAENINQYLKKGDGIVIEGRLKQDTWEQDGHKRSKVKIVVAAFHFMPKRDRTDAGSPSGSQQDEQAGSGGPESIDWQE